MKRSTAAGLLSTALFTSLAFGGILAHADETELPPLNPCERIVCGSTDDAPSDPEPPARFDLGPGYDNGVGPDGLTPVERTIEERKLRELEERQQQLVCTITQAC